MALSEHMKNFFAKNTRNQFGKMIDEARLEPVIIGRRGRPVAGVCSVEDLERINASVVGPEREDKS